MTDPLEEGDDRDDLGVPEAPGEDDLQLDDSDNETWEDLDDVEKDDDLQPEDSSAAVLADAQREVDRLKRLLADQEVVNEMAREGFNGPKTRMWANDMAAYGVAVLKAQLLTGVAFRYAAEKNRPVQGATGSVRQVLRESDEARSDLATLTVAMTLPKFIKNALQDGKWNAAGGASLNTYFIGATHQVLKDAFLKWVLTIDTNEQRLDETLPTTNVQHLPDHAVVGNDAFERLIALAPEANRDIIRLYVAGYTQEEIAEITNRKSQAAIEGVIYRYRQVLRRHGYS